MWSVRKEIEELNAYKTQLVTQICQYKKSTEELNKRCAALKLYMLNIISIIIF